MISYFQTSYGHDTPGIMALLLFATVFGRWIYQPTRPKYAAIAGTAILATWSARPAVIFVGTIGIYGMIVGQWRHRIGILILSAITEVSIAIMLGLYELW